MVPIDVTDPLLAESNGRGVEIIKAKKIITMARQPVEALATLAGHVIATGLESELRRVFPGAPVTDFGAHVVTPGFNDAHMHLAQTADLLLYLDVSPDSVASIEDIKGTISAEAKTKSTGSWIRGVRYDDGKTEEKRILSRWDLDEAAPDHPVLVIHIAGHWGVANSRALAAGGIDERSSPPAGGEFGREADGRLNGVLYEYALETNRYKE